MHVRPVHVRTRQQMETQLRLALLLPSPHPALLLLEPSVLPGGAWGDAGEGRRMD